MGSECPIDGCRKPFDTPNALANHIFRSQKGQHDDIEEWNEADELARGSWNEGTPSEGGKSGDGDDPTVGETEPQESGTDGEPACPKCGGTNLFDPAAVPGVPSNHPATDHDRACKDCSTAETWEVFDL